MKPNYYGGNISRISEIMSDWKQQVKEIGEKGFKFLCDEILKVIQNNNIDFEKTNNADIVDGTGGLTIWIEHKYGLLLAKYKIIVYVGFWNKMNYEEKVDFLLHELEHFRRAHLLEVLERDYDSEIFNILADSVINKELDIYKLGGIKGWYYPISLFGEGGIFNKHIPNEFDMMEHIEFLIRDIARKNEDAIKSYYEVKTYDEVKKIVISAILYDFYHHSYYTKKGILLYNAIVSNSDIEEIKKKVPKGTKLPKLPPGTIYEPVNNGGGRGTPTHEIEEETEGGTGGGPGGEPGKERKKGGERPLDKPDIEEIKKQLKELAKGGIDVKKLISELRGGDVAKAGQVFNELADDIKEAIKELSEDEKKKLRKAADAFREIAQEQKKLINELTMPTRGAGFETGEEYAELELTLPLYLTELFAILRKIKSLFSGQSWSRKRTYRREGRIEGMRGSAFLPSISVLCALDVSGSIEHYVHMFIGLAKGLRKKYDVTVSTFASSKHFKTYKNYDDLTKIRGLGGGTEAVPVIQEAVKGKYDAIVMLTDTEIVDGDEFFGYASKKYKGKIIVVFPRQYKDSYKRLEEVAKKNNFNRIIPISISEEADKELQELHKKRTQKK